MNKTTKPRRVSSKKLRRIFHDLADDICDTQDKIMLSLNGNSFEINLEGATINITYTSKEGGR